MNSAPGLSRREVLRKVVHVGSLGPAFLLPWLSWPLALVLALSGAAFGLLVLPRVGGRALWREAERGRGLSLGIVLYPVAVAVLVLVFRERLGIVAAGWALLALGDGSASLVGQAWGRHPLPWNVHKSLEGLLAHVACGGLGAAGLLWFVGDASLTLAPVTLGVSPLTLALAVGLAAAVVTALLESVQLGLDDNLVVPLAGAGVIWLLLAAAEGAPFWDHHQLALQCLAGLGLSALLAVSAWRRGSLSASGAVAAAGVGALTLGAGSAAAFATLLAFFAIGTGATRLGRSVKEARGIAEARGGRRAAGNVLANGGLAAAAALLIPGGELLARDARLVLVAALATAAFDTVSSEVGKAYGRVTVLATSLRRVPPGTEGAVSLEGTLAGFAGAVLLAAVGLVSGLLPAGPLAVAAVVLGAFIGTTFESLLGAACAGRGNALDNDLINFLNTAVGAAAALVVVKLGSLLHMMRLLRLAVELSRPFTLLAPWVGFLSAGLAALGIEGAARLDAASLVPLLIGSLMSATLNAASNTINQIYDRDIDAVNKPRRPIPSGRVTLREAWWLTLVFYGAALGMAWVADPPAGIPGHGSHSCFWIVLVAAFLTWAYSAPPLRTKRLGWVANLTIAVPRGVLLKVAGWSSVLTIADVEPWYVGLIFGLFLIGATNTKDFADVEGDRRGGCRTLPVALGVDRAARLTAPFFVVPFLLIPLGAWSGVLSGDRWALTVLGMLMAGYGAWIGRLMVRDTASLAVDSNHPSWAHMYAMMLLGQLGFAVAYWL